MSSIDSPIPLADIESVLAWVDTFKLSRPTKKINRDFSDAVLLAEILNVYYPKLVEMHNYPPRNSHSLKLNNWMTLNRKVLKKLKLNLCNNTMEQLANCAPGIIERVLVMVRDKIRRDEDLNKSMKEGEQNMSSGGSYYEACGEDENILVVPVKVRVNGVLEVIQKKVVSHESYLAVKEEMKDARDSADLLKQKVEHLDNLLKLKDERIEELQKQLERKQSRRKEVEILQNSLSVPFDEPPSPNVNDLVANKLLPLKSVESLSKLPKEESRIPIPIIDLTKSISKPSITEVTSKDCIENDIIERVKSNLFKENSLSVPFDEPPSPNVNDLVANKLLPLKCVESLPKLPKEESRIPIPIIDLTKSISKPSITEVTSKDCIENDIIERVKSNLFKEIIDKTNTEGFYDTQELVNEGEKIATIETTIQKEIKEICEYNGAPNMLI